MVRDQALSALRGRYIFGDYCRGVIESARLRGAKARDVKATRLKVDSLSSFGVDAPPPRLRGVAQRPGLPARPALTVGSLADHGIVLVRADNPSPLTLTGTNTWIVGPLGRRSRPGDRRAPRRGGRRGRRRGGAGGIALTHDHEDHVEGLPGAAVPRWAACPWSRPATARPTATCSARCGSSRCPATPTTTSRSSPAAPRSSATRCSARAACSCPATCAGYLDGLRRLRALDLAVLCPGHGEPIWDVAGKLDGYVEHRLDRERRLVEALDRGLRSEDELLDAAWADAPAALRPFAAMSLRAHLEKLRAEGRA